MIVYGSLFPFDFRASAGGENPLLHLLGTWREWDARGDLLSNILLYMPLGFFASLSCAERWSAGVRLLITTLVGVLLSVCMESLQVYDVGRVSSMGDVDANAIGTALGAAAAALLGAGLRWPYVQALADNPDGSLLLAAFLGYRLFPYVPVIDLHKYLNAVRPLLWHPMPQPAELARSAVGWLLIAAVIHGLYGLRRWFVLFPALAAIEFAGRILIIGASLLSRDVAGAATAFMLWAACLGWTRYRFAIVAAACTGLIITARLEPFQFAATPAQTFNWVPFWSLMHGSINVAVQAFFEKSLQYGGLIWLLMRAGVPATGATVVTAGLLLATSYAELYVPGRSAEITDAVMAMALGGAFILLQNTGRLQDAGCLQNPGRRTVPAAAGPPTGQSRDASSGL